MSADNPLAPPPLPPVRRLTRAVWIVVALVACITVFVVLFLVGPRKSATARLPAPRPLTGSDPGFLQHAPGELPPRPPVPPAPEEYLRGLQAQQPSGYTGGPLPAPLAPAGADRLAAEREPSSDYGLAPNRAAASAPPGDPRREAFARALAAPLSRGPSIPPSRDPRESEAEGLVRWLAPFRGDTPTPLQPPGTSPSNRTRSAGSDAAWTANADLSADAWPPRGASPPSPSAPPLTAAGADWFHNRGRSLDPGSANAPGGSSTVAVRFHPRPGPSTLPAGTLIPALLLTEVNSDLPGNLLAQVSRDVYDFRQEVVLIPSGTRLLGRYDSQIALGQSRLLVAWTRVVFPDGSGFDFPGLPGTDAGGAAGLSADVNRHILRTFGDALLLSLLSAGAQLSQPQSTSFATAPSAGNVAAGALGQELSAAGLELLRRDISIQPTLRLPAATPFLVFVNGDIDLAPLLAGAATGGPNARP